MIIPAGATTALSSSFELKMNSATKVGEIFTKAGDSYNKVWTLNDPHVIIEIICLIGAQIKVKDNFSMGIVSVVLESIFGSLQLAHRT